MAYSTSGSVTGPAWATAWMARRYWLYTEPLASGSRGSPRCSLRRRKGVTWDHALDGTSGSSSGGEAAPLLLTVCASLHHSMEYGSNVSPSSITPRSTNGSPSGCGLPSSRVARGVRCSLLHSEPVGSSCNPVSSSTAISRPHRNALAWRTGIGVSSFHTRRKPARVENTPAFSNRGVSKSMNSSMKFWASAWLSHASWLGRSYSRMAQSSMTWAPAASITGRALTLMRGRVSSPATRYGTLK